QIYPRHPNQEFIVPPSSDEEIVSFIKELRYLGDIDSVSKKKTLVAVEEPIEKLVKKPTARRQSAGVQVRDTPKSKVPDEPKGKSIDTSRGTGLKPEVPDVSKADSSKSDVDLNKTDDEEEKEFLHTPDDYVPTDDENKDDEEYAHINKEMYDDMNMKLRDTEREGVRKDDEKMTDVGHVAAEHENVNQEVIGDQVKDDAQETVIDAHAIQKTEVPLPSSSILSDYATKFLNFDNIPSANTEIISMIDIKVQHVNPCIHTSPLLTIPVLEVKQLKNVDHSSALLVIIKYEVSTAVNEYLGISLDDAFYKSQYLEDKDAMDKGVVDKLKKRKPDDVDRDEGPPAGSNQGLKRKKSSKDDEPSKKEKSTESSKGTTKSQPKSTGKSTQAKETMFEAGDTQVPHNQGDDMGNIDEPPVVYVDSKEWFKKPERLPTQDPKWNECKIVNHKPTQKWLSDLAKAKK
nr:hypothetical protein [Tanacetum cinerariifolium]